MHICYEEKNFTEAHMAMIDRCNDIITEYMAQRYVLTLRQLYYQMVSRDIIVNNLRSYKNLGNLVTDARKAGLISWSAIEDKNRSQVAWHIEEEQQNVFSRVEMGFALDLWARQGVHLEVWVEKDALSSVIRRPCAKWRVPYMACKGYLSASTAWEAGQRMWEADQDGQRCVVIHLGDHDPSGIDMTRDNRDRLRMFGHDADIEVRRIALNMDQIERYNPPTNPAKMSDSRAGDYLAQFGESSWELDALSPSVLDSLISDTIEEYIDPDVWEATLAEEEEVREHLKKIHANWDQVDQFLHTL